MELIRYVKVKWMTTIVQIESEEMEVCYYMAFCYMCV